jgi:diguanylate cyclase (GGDEF)-like protein/PAS domain S-box-containing protein
VLAELVALTFVVLSWPRSGLHMSLTLRGHGGLSGTPLVLARPAAVGHFTVLQELLPTIAMVGVLAIAVARRPTLGDVFRIGNAVVLLVLFAAQQVVAVIERVRLANGLQETIVAGTAELSLADARFRSLVESSDDAIISATPDGLVSSWNAAAQRLLGYCGPEILGRPADLIIPEDERAEWVQIRRSFGKGSTRRSFETERVHKDGTLVPVSLTVSPIYDGDTVTGVSGILRDITDRLALQQEMEFRALHDSLTGLPNRELLTDRFEQALRADKRAGTRTGLLVVDLDRFKEVNDTFGYHYGDELLRQVGPRLAGVLRGVDTVARLGGDEFGVLLPGMGCAAEATAVASKLAAALEMPFHVEGVDLDVEASIGVVISGEHGHDVTTLLRHADIAMDVAKTQTLAVFTYDPAFDSHTPSKLALLGDLRRALERSELVLHYQPKVSLSTGDVVGAEALVRWAHPERCLVFPDDFIPMAEHTTLIGPLTRHILDTALAQARTWIDAGRPLPIAVNLSARNLLDEHLADQVGELLAAHGVPSALLELEVTESAIMIDPVRARQMLEQLSALGVAISIDDFGAGYTSLSQLTTLPVNELKIDRSFVLTMMSDPGHAMIVQSVIELGHNLGLALVAEGVETEQAAAALAALQCDVAQGYHLCRPLPVAAFDNWYAENTLTVPTLTTPKAPSVTALGRSNLR